MMRRRTLFAACAFVLCASPSGPAAAQGGISAEQYERLFPQAPRALSATLEGRRVALRWSAPPGRQTYDRRLARYRVIRIRGEVETVVADTTRTRAIDRPGPGRVSYVVVTVEKSGRTGARSDPAEIVVP